MIKESTLWRNYSLYIRLRDANDSGYCKCISCGEVKHYSEMQAGHYYSRRIKSLKYYDKNVNAQCVRCNWYLKGNVANYINGLINKYGDNVIEDLQMRKKTKVKLDRFYINSLNQNILNKLKTLKYKMTE